jgi:hypothetical protein
MNRTLRAILGAGLLALSGNAAAILINDHQYGTSDYRLEEIDLAIQELADQVTSKADRKRVKKARKLDRKVTRLAGKLYRAETVGKTGKLAKKNRKLTRKENRLLNMLAGFLPVDDNIILADISGIGPFDIPVIDIPPPELSELLPLPREIITPPDSGPFGTNTLAGQGPVSGNPAVAAAVPEPPLAALLLLGLLPVIGLRRISKS